MADLLKYKLSDQTTVGMPVDTSIFTSAASDKTAIAVNDKLYKWYMETLPMVTDPNSKKIYDNVLSVVNRNSRTQAKVKDLSLDIVKRIENLNHKTPTKLAETITPVLGNSSLPTTFTAAGGGNRFTEFLDTYKKAKDPSTPGPATDPATKLRNLITAYKGDPIVTPESEAITPTDRIVFLAITFIIRGLSLYMVEWAVNTYMVKSFQEAFGMYLVCYVSLFLVWAILVNASNSLFLRMLFYYISTDPHGYGRAIVHLGVQMMVLPIPLVVKTKGFDYTEEEYTFESRRKTMSILSNFTFFTWAITSIIAIRY